MSTFQNNTTGICDFANELYLGGVELWISELATDGSIIGFRCMGCAEDATLTSDETVLEVDRACTGVRETLEFITKRKLSVAFTTQNATLQNMAKVLSGSVTSYVNPAVAGFATVVQAVGGAGNATAKGQTIAIRNAAKLRAYGFLTAGFVAEQAAVSGGPWTAMTVTTDYTIDATNGTIYLVPGGGFTDGNFLRVTVPASVAAPTPIVGFDALTLPRKQVAVRLVLSNGIKGEDKGELIVFSVFLKADGDLALSGTDILKIGFSGTAATSGYYGKPLEFNDIPSV